MMHDALAERPADAAAHPRDDVVARAEADPRRGLTATEAARRLRAHGPNELPRAEAVSPLALLARQFRSVVVWVLIGAAVVSAALGDTLDAAAILAIVALNAAIGFLQEHRAERAVAALSRLTAPRARVVRDGRAVVVPAAEVVRGDVLLLDGGDLVAADAQLVDAAALRTVEAALTGESAPVDKRATPCPPDAPLAERWNMVFLGTSVASGTGRAVVVATGAGTELGAIAALLERAGRDDTPLQRQLDRVGHRLLWACLAIVVAVFALGIARATDVLELFMGAVSLAVAAIPEGLPAVVTVALALGVQRMARRNALVRRLPSVETLGCADVVCTDKTGTLTVGEMTVRKVVTSDRIFSVTGEGYATDGAVFEDGTDEPVRDDPVLHALVRVAAGCNDAELGERDGRPAVVGDPTEGALLVLAAKCGVTRHRLEVEQSRIATLPFDPERKRMAVLRRDGDAVRACVKGAPEVILERCATLRTAAGEVPLDEPARARMLEASSLLASDGLRVLALAERGLPAAAAPDAAERQLAFLGLAGMQDPPRADAREAVERCRRAGVRTVMITGDHADTARAIARELGILEPGDHVLLGRDLEAMDDAALADRIRSVTVFARVTAEHKLRIVRAWKARGAVVAMTGDGVNDAPALKEASIGIAMGIAGTEVTKEAADLVIADDDFATIVDAIEEGRGVYDNIAKTLGYLLAGNAGELAVMLVAAVLGWPLPLLPIQLLWINLVTDGLPALGLATDPIDPSVLARPPRDPRVGLLDRRFLARVAGIGCLTAVVALVAFASKLDAGAASARNAAFSVIVFDELLRSFAARSATRTIWEVGLLSNLRLVAIVAVSFGLQLSILNVPALGTVFGTTPVSLAECATWLALGAVPVTVLELGKLGARRRPPPPSRAS
jgi:Ca2+-transporting ATPase